MKKSLLRLTLLACAALGSHAGAHAAAPSPTIKPGLWQVDSKMASPDAATDNAMSMVLQQLGNLPPDQRKQLESMAASRGMAMPTVGADGAVRVTACVTPDMAARKQIPTGQPGDCKSKNTDIAGGMQVSFTCANPKSSGEGKVMFTGDQAFNMQLAVTTSARGAPEQVNVTSSGKWLGASCPAPAPAAASIQKP
ncbi:MULTISPECIES: DUF3617 domain-containing protein [unclassified Janthinobacterium]|uniref:DUF3617 domain-containing protein n=1 Tax=unclassified Janthinobacterium TaxID=2610881 RepID=UPI0025B4A700|nr:MULTISPECIES: DUF3617 domain-containing protein [unclassified Janthinobacterium]MDN2703378.1 DUF3617 domain-containing protein [Janthinobacterium sp. SUN100]MDN2717906.1 DUF3617 domain-containing protein [Janthinobacterium sp. SUN120]MDO8051971.1 DUF3617 domain-containing protein [Janthinobacterium sp. SUN211]